MAVRASFGGLRLDSRAVNNLLRSPAGPVVRHAQVRANRVKNNARRMVGVSEGAGGGDPGHLRDKIVTRLGSDGRGVFVAVGTFGGGEGYSLYHHEGTRPHVILPRRGRFLVFEVDGQTVYATRVNHPGTRPNPYLLDAARAEGLRVRKLS